MAKYQKYADYKNVPSAFLKEIPTNWDIKPLYTLCEFKQGKAHEPYVDDDGEYIYVSARFVSTQGASFKQCSVNLTPAKINDVLMVMSDLPNGRALAKAFFVKEMKKYAVNQRVCAITAKRINPKFIYYQLDRSPHLLMNDDGSNQTHLSNNDFMKYPVLVPSKIEQKKIVDFLDHETAKIDTLIAKQEKLIELLKEKRQAVISHAVTKGLNPDVAMKDSGVEWLGQVPEHWVKTKIKYVAELTPKKSELTYQENQLCTFVPMEKLKLGTLITDEEKLISKVIGGYTYFEDGDVLLAKVTPCFENKNMVVAQGLKNGIGFGSSEIYVLRTNQKIFAQFLYFRLQEDMFMELGAGAMTGAGGLKRVPSDFLTNFEFALPSLDEQREISDYILEIQSKYDDLSSKAESAIQLMQERRTALISSAVTGKIDVRNWQHPNYNNNEANTELGA